MIRFYAPDIAATCKLPAEESAHAIRVLRRRAGDEIEAVDGRGTLYRCRLVDDDARGATVETIETVALPKVWSPEITIAVAPTKHNDRLEWLVEKLVEIGVDRIVPVRCERSERKDIKTDRLVRIAVSAMKQSLKAVLPRIDETMPLKTFLNEQALCCKFVGYCDSATERRLLATAYKPGSDVRILIGPEGDFTPAEIAMATEAGYIPVTMGDNRLRTETAALVGCDTIHIVNQIFNR